METWCLPSTGSAQWAISQCSSMECLKIQTHTLGEANTTSLPKKESRSFPVCYLSTANHVKPIRSWVETNSLQFFFFNFHRFLLNTIGLYRPWNYPGQNTRVGSRSLLKGIFPTQGSNPGLWHCRWIFYQLSHKRNPKFNSKYNKNGIWFLQYRYTNEKNGILF